MAGGGQGPGSGRVIMTHPGSAPHPQVAAAPPAQPLSGRVRGSRAAFRVVAWVLAAAVVGQVFLAGAAVMSDPTYWALHRSFVHAFELLPLVLAVLAVLGKGTRLLIGLSVLGFFLIGIQYAFVGARPSLVASLHVVNALLVFGLAVMLAIVAGRAPLPPGATKGPGWRSA